MDTDLGIIEKLDRQYGKNLQRVRKPGQSFILGVVVVLSIMWSVGCSSPPKTTPPPSKEKIQSDADRFFEKLEKEKQGKPEAQRQ